MGEDDSLLTPRLGDGSRADGGDAVNVRGESLTIHSFYEILCILRSCWPDRSCLSLCISPCRSSAFHMLGIQWQWIHAFDAV